MEKVDLLIENVMVYNTVFQKFFDADVYVKKEKIYYIDLKKEKALEPSKVINGEGKYMIPGLVDVHMHIESSMMTPMSMAGRLRECGVTTIVSEPHEMANVNGIEGILDMMKAGEHAPIDILYGIPSCVPATNTTLETTGGVIDYEKMKELLYHPKVACVGEIMNYRQIIKENDLEISKLLDYLDEHDHQYIIEGHCPSLVDLDLAKFIYLGIDSDHTEHNIEELKQRFFNGMYVEIQGKMLRQDVLDFIEENHLYGHFGFVTDDVMADTLMDEGHLDAIVRKAIKMGMKPEQAIYHATYTNAIRMNLTDRTMIAPGKLADFILLDDLSTFEIGSVFKKGKNIFQKHEKKQSIKNEGEVFDEKYRHMIKLDLVDESVFSVFTEDEKAKTATVEVMTVVDGSTKTVREDMTLPVKDQEVLWEKSPLLLAVVFERYGKKNGIGYGFVTGDALKEGAVATTFAHDHHNLLAVGKTKKELVKAVNEVIRIQGGMCVSKNDEILAKISLNVGGILSDAPAKEVAKDLKNVREQLQRLGYQHYNPIMSLCTLSLLASPALKISDQGIVDVAKGQVVPLIKKEVR